MSARAVLHRADLVAIAAAGIALPGWWVSPRLFWASWLCAWWFCVGVAMGGLVNVAMHALTGGRWGEAVGLGTAPLARRLPWLLLLFLPMAAGWRHVFPWAAEPPADWTRDIALPAFERAWFAPAFFWPRLLAIGLAWAWIARPATFSRKGRAALALLVYAITGTVATFDLVVSLVPGWYSSAHGLVNLAGGALGGAALAILVVTLRAPHAFPTPPAIPGRTRRPPVWRDLGNLLLMWLLLWAYVAFLEFLILWSENLPREVAWIVPRVQGGWGAIGIALVALQFGGCFVALLLRAVKDDPARLAIVSGVLLAGQLVDSAWLILPSVDAQSALGWWLVPALTCAMGLPFAARAWHDVDEARDALASTADAKEVARA